MSVSDASAGYPVHAVASLRRHVTQNGITLTDWTATCGETGQLVGSRARMDCARYALSAELCKTCWPAGHRTYHPDPVEKG